MFGGSATSIRRGLVVIILHISTICLACLAPSLSGYDGASAARTCPADAIVDPLYEFFGDRNDIEWHASALKQTDGRYCFQRSIGLAIPRQWIHWPLGGVVQKVVEKESKSRFCCDYYPIVKNGPLEYGASGNTFETQVAVGKSEPIAETSLSDKRPTDMWASVERKIVIGKRLVNLDITVGSRYEVAKAPSGKTVYRYTYYAWNEGDEVSLTWKAVESKFFFEALRERDLKYPLRVGALQKLEITGSSFAPPILTSGPVSILDEAGKPMDLIALNGYVPK